MKIFNTLQNLWTYALFCPICQDTCRDISIAVGPSGIIDFEYMVKDNEILKINAKIRFNNGYYRVYFVLDCIQNTFEYIIPDTVNDPKYFKEATARTNLFFFLESDCKKCVGSWTNGKDIELNFLTKKIENIGLEREELWLTKTKNQFSLAFEYMDNYMSIAKIEPWVESDDISNVTINNNNLIHLPITEFDFKNYNKTINRIKTMLVFS